MSAYRAVVGWGKLVRNKGEYAVELPKKSVGGAYASPYEIITASTPTTYLEQGKWQRFGAGISCDVTRTRNINYHNDIGKREYTIATTGIYEPDFTINGMVSADNLEWLAYAFNMATFPQAGSGAKAYTYTFKYAAPQGPKMFDICYLQSNSQTNEYAGFDEVHILTGCAIDKVTINYELGSDAGVSFSIEGKALMDYMSLASNINDVNDYLEDIPQDVFSTGCLSYSETYDSDDFVQIAQTDRASISIENFLERRGNCNTNWGSGYSMGTMNFTVDAATYGNDPKKMELAFLGYARNEIENIYSVKKVPHKTKRILIHMDNGDPTSTNIDKQKGDKRLNIVLTDAIVNTLDKKYESEQAIVDEASLRGSVGYIDVYTKTSNWGLGYTAPKVLGTIAYNLDGGSWDADAAPVTTTADTSGSVTLPTNAHVSKAGYTFTGWKATTNNDGINATGSEITQIAKSTINGVTGAPAVPYRIIATWTANS